MKKLVATVALLCLSSTVLAHDIYSDLRDRDGRLCCGGQDCMPVQVKVLPDGNYYLPSTDETIPADMAAPSPDNRFHIASIIHEQVRMILMMDKYGKAKLRLDASLLQ